MLNHNEYYVVASDAYHQLDALLETVHRGHGVVHLLPQIGAQLAVGQQRLRRECAKTISRSYR